MSVCNVVTLPVDLGHSAADGLRLIKGVIQDPGAGRIAWRKGMSCWLLLC